MDWPPPMSVTSRTLINGYRHYVVINYGGKGLSRWANLVSVLDSDSSFKLLWSELIDTNLWTSGWDDIPRDMANSPEKKRYVKTKSNNNDICLQPSNDSGLMIPSQTDKIRAWY